MVAFGTLTAADKSWEANLAIENATLNKGVAKQLKVLEKTLYKKGADAATVAAAMQSCVRLNEAGLEPQEARKMVAKEVTQCLKQGIKGIELSQKIQEMTQAKVQEKLMQSEQLKTMTQQRLQDGVCEEKKEAVRTGMPEGKGSEGSPSVGGGTGSGGTGGPGSGKGK